MTITQKFVNALIKRILRTFCRIDESVFKKIPQKGPLLAIGNHINFLEVPIIATHLYPRPINALTKAESWENPFKRYLFNMWGGIPVDRGEADRTALRLVLDAFKENERIVGIAPEGTRSHHGGLQQGHPGVVLMALRSGSPVLPVSIFGTEDFWQNLRKLKRTNVGIVVGNPFRLDSHGESLSREVREQMISEVMYQLAALLPPKNRGIYSDLQNATSKYLVFESGEQNNLLYASEENKT